MQGQTIRIVSQAIGYIEDNLDNKLELDIVAAALHYSNSILSVKLSLGKNKGKS